jgi:carbonic anhydrase
MWKIDTESRSVSCACCGDALHSRFDRRRFLKLSAGGLALAALPSFASAAEGNYEAMVLSCIDPRFPEPTLNYMKGRGMLGKYSQFVFAGAAIGVVAPAFKDWQMAFWDNLAASIQLHHIPKVIAINHRDCGAAKIAYGEPKVANRRHRDRDPQGGPGRAPQAGGRAPAQARRRDRVDGARREGRDVHLSCATICRPS